MSRTLCDLSSNDEIYRMKNKLYLIVLVIGMFACEESITPEPVELINLESSSRGNSLGTYDPLEAQRMDFENQMEWVAYMIASAVVTDADAKADFQDCINDYGSLSGISVRLKLKDLLGSPALEYRDFRSKFEELYYYYQNGALDGCSRLIGGSPRPLSPSGGNPIGIEPAPLYISFITQIVFENCLEIYLPYGFSGSTNEVNSTAHPLNGNGFNDSYSHDSICVEGGTISPFNTHLLSNPLVVRPYRSIQEGCEYEQYPSLNFEEFLSLN